MDIALYTRFEGASPSGVHEGFMGRSALLARQVGRQQDSLNSLDFVATLFL
jgi:hypothetical protein